MYVVVFHNYFLTLQNYVPNWDPPATSEMWKFLDQVVDLFTPTIKGISILEGDSYPSQALILLVLASLEKKAITMQQKCKL